MSKIPEAPPRTRMEKVITGAVATIVSMFSLLTFVYNLPESEMRTSLTAVDRIMEPTFHQRWTLFAPDAPTADYGLLASYNGDNASIDFTDLTTSELSNIRGSLIPPRAARELGGMVTVYASVESDLLGADFNAEKFQAASAVTPELVEESLAEARTQDPRLYEDYLEIRQMLANGVLDRLGGDDLKAQCQREAGEVTLRLVAVPIPGKHTEAGESTVRELGTFTCGEDFDAAI